MNKNQSKIHRGIDKARTQVRAWFSGPVDNRHGAWRYGYRGNGGPMSQEDIIARRVLGVVGVTLIVLIMMTVELLIILAVVGK